MRGSKAPDNRIKGVILHRSPHLVWYSALVSGFLVLVGLYR